MVVPLLIAVGAILSAIGAYLTMKQAPRDAVVLVKGLLVGAAFFLLVYVSFGNYAGTLMRSRQAQNQARAVVSLRKIHSCASSYQARYPDHGFPANLTMLGPEGEKCIDERLVKGRVAGYILTYTPGKRDGQGRIVGYSLAGHPGKFGIHGTQIYVSDHAELIHVTSEDRPAEATDPVVR